MLLPGPPRSIPLAFQVKSILGSTLSLTGWFGLLAAAFLIIAGINGSDLYGLQKDPDQMPHTQGQIVSVKAFKSTKNSGFYYYYEYLIQGKAYQGQFILHGHQKYPAKQSVEVAYLEDHPEQSVIPEHAPEAFNRITEFVVFLGMSLLCALFGMAFIAMIIMTAYDGWCDLKLLKQGELVQGKLGSLDTSIQGMTVIQYRLVDREEPYSETFSNQRQINLLNQLPLDSEIPVLKMNNDVRAVWALLPNQSLTTNPLWLICLLVPPLVFSLICFMWNINL